MLLLLHFKELWMPSIWPPVIFCHQGPGGMSSPVWSGKGMFARCLLFYMLFVVGKMYQHVFHIH